MSSPEPYSPEVEPRQYCFGDFTFDLESGFLRRGREEVPLRPKPFDVLAYLVQHHGRLVTKTALTEAVWPNEAVTHNSLAQSIVEIRRALGDDAQQLIRTVPRRGYIFTAPVTVPVREIERHAIAGSHQIASLVGASKKSLYWPLFFAVLASLAILGELSIRWRGHPAKPDLLYTQITNFTDSATAPALSPDGRMLAFLRSDDWFMSTDQIYLRLLPNGEPVEITHDPRRKYGPAFSPDGSRIAYTVLDHLAPAGWQTFTVPVTGGEPRLLLANASGLTWLDERRFLFSEIATGTHMGVVTATEGRAEYRNIYFPEHERAMAHFSYASPDRKWAVIAEMDPIWHPCRLVALDGSSIGRQVGPQGKCTSAAWSPDQRWMYFGVEVDGGRHLWRQRFPNGQPEQITSGPTQEEGIAMAPDGHSLITSIGLEESAVWIHDTRGERPLFTEGHAAPMHVYPYSSARFSPDGKLLYYLTRPDSPASPVELWRVDLASAKTQLLLRGASIAEYDLSSDGKEVVYSAHPQGKPSEIWLASLDPSSPQKRIASSGEAWPHFGPGGSVFFESGDGKANYLFRMNRDGSGRSKVVPYPIGNVYGTSPDRRWVVVGLYPHNGESNGTMALPVEGGTPRKICSNYCPASWTPDGRVFYIGVEPRSRTGAGKTIAVPVPPEETFPKLPVSGIRGVADAKSFPGARILDAWDISPGLDPSVFAYTKTTVHKNLFRISLRD